VGRPSGSLPTTKIMYNLNFSNSNCVEIWENNLTLQTSKEVWNGCLKAVSDLRIPELSEISGRGYRHATFHWDEKLYNVPESYRYLCDYEWVSIDQNIQDRNLYRVVLRGRDIKSKEIIMETKDREKFELYLISNPLIKATSETFGNYA